jgi:hypothetical protein
VRGTAVSLVSVAAIIASAAADVGLGSKRASDPCRRLIQQILCVDADGASRPR